MGFFPGPPGNPACATAMGGGGGAKTQKTGLPMGDGWMFPFPSTRSRRIPKLASSHQRLFLQPKVRTAVGLGIYALCITREREGLGHGPWFSRCSRHGKKKKKKKKRRRQIRHYTSGACEHPRQHYTIDLVCVSQDDSAEAGSSVGWRNTTRDQWPPLKK